MIARRLALLIAVSIFLVVCLVPDSEAQNRGKFTGAVNSPAGPPVAATNTGYLLGGVLPLEVKLGDVNNDGKPDLIVAAGCSTFFSSQCLNGYAIAVYLSNGDGTFQPAIISGGLTVPAAIRSIAVGDFNNDGKLDVAVASDSGCSSAPTAAGCISILLGAGDGTFALASQYPFDGVVSQAGTLAVGDFNKDGRLDLAVGQACFNLSVTGCTSGAVSIYLGNGDGTLAAPTSYITVGNSALYPVVGDFNGDGKLDVIAGSGVSPNFNSQSSLTVLLGNGDGTFAEFVPTFSFGGLGTLAVGDFNSDGKLDLATISSGVTLQILLGNGDGTFQAPVGTPTGLAFPVTNGNTIAVVDLNGDGKPDLVISGGFAGSQVNGVLSFLNDGTGNFIVGQAYPIGGWLYAPIAVADFNGDGKADLVMASGCSESVQPGNHCPDGSISVLLGNGNGTFQGPVLFQTPAGGVGVYSSGVADFNGDGIPDVFVSDACPPGTAQCGVAILLGKPDGTYQAPVVVASGAQEPIDSLAGDFNGDGKQDLAILNACDSATTCSSPSVSVVLGNGDGTFQAPVTYSVGGSTSVAGIVTGDFNGDGKLDIAVATPCDTGGTCAQGTVSILLGNGDGTFQNAVTTGIGPGVAASIAAADFDHDGKTDVVVGNTNPTVDNPYAEFATILLSNGDGTLRVAGSYDTGGAATPNGVRSVIAVTGDINHDGNIDVVIANGCESPAQNDASCSNGSIGVLLGNGDGTFKPVQTTVATDGNLLSANLSDVDGDGNLDLIASTTGGVMVARGKGDGTFYLPAIYGGLAEITNETLAVADLNNDGAPDIVQPDNGGNLAIFYNRGGTFLTTATSGSPSIAGQPVTFTGTVTASIAKSLTATGTISFYDGNLLLGTASILNGAGSVTVSNLAVGNHTVTVSYSGDSNFNPHTGPGLLQVVVPALVATQVTLTSSLNPSNVGQTVTFTAAASSASGVPTGTVQFNDNGLALATMSLSNGQAIFSTASLSQGSHTISANYGGDSGHSSNISATLYQSVLSAQTGAVLVGVVTDRNTGVPLAGVGVIFGCASCSPQTVTDGNGQYSLTASQISNNSNAVLIFQGHGYFATQVNYTITSTPTVVDATLLPGGTLIQGTITDANTHLPIAGAQVGVSNSTQTLNGLSTTSDSSGNYAIDSSKVFESVASGFNSQGISATASGYFTYIGSSFQVAPPYPVVMNAAMIPASGIVLQGTVRDRNTSAPLAGVGVIFGCASCSPQTVTDGNGQYSLTASQISNNSNAVLIFQGHGYFATQVNYTITSTPTVVDATLLPGGTLIQGTITDANTHLPIAGAQVGVSNSTQTLNGLSTTSDSSGNYAIDSSKVFESVASGFNSQGISATASGYFTYIGSSFQVAPPYPVVMNAAMIPASGIVLQGTVRDRNTSAPLAGVGVIFGCASCSPQTVTDGNGQYSLTASQISNNSNAVLIFQGHGYFATQVNYTITSTPTVVDATLLPGGTLIQGTITDANTHLPIAGAQVGVSNSTQTLNGLSTTSDSSGNYAIDSSKVFESVASGFNSQGIDAVSSPGYFTFIGSPFQVRPPYPVIQNAQMTPTGVTVSVSVATAPPNLQFTVDGVAYSSAAAFTWVPNNVHSIATTTPQAGSTGTQYAFLNWSNGGQLSQTVVVPVVNMTYTATFGTQYLLTTSSNPAAGGTITAGGYFNAGSSVVITATPNPGYTFTGFSGALGGTTNPQILTMSGPVSVTATFAPAAAPTTTTLVSSANPDIFGQSVTFTATVSGTNSPTGTVTFKDGSTVLATVALTGNLASLSTSSLVVGSHPITAAYSGDAANKSSASAILYESVTTLQAGAVLYGTVADRTTGLPIAGVSITNCTQCSKGGGALTTTDGSGSYSLTAAQLGNTSTGLLNFQVPGYFVTAAKYPNATTPTVLDVTLLPGGTLLQGTITDGSTQAGIAGATVTMPIQGTQSQFPSGSSLILTTVSGGQYAIDSSNFYEAAAAGFTVSGVGLSASGYFNNSAAGFSVSVPFPVTQNFTMLADSGVVLQGTVTDRSTGLPIAGVAVTNCGMCGKGVAPTTTDANGNYSLTGTQLNGNASGNLYFQTQGYYANTASYTITTIPTTLNATLLPGGTVLQGTITDASTQAGIAGAFLTMQIQVTQGQVVAFPGGNFVNATTVSGGHYIVDSSSFYEAAAAGFTVSGVGLSASGYFNNSAAGFSVSAPFPVTQNFTMLADSGVVLQGTVTDRSTGLPIAGVAVTNCGMCGKGVAPTTTDANGNYSLNGTQLNGNASGNLYFQAQGYYANTASYTITTIPTTLNATLLPGGTLLQGTITDASTQAGIVGASVLVQPQTTQGQQPLAFPNGVVSVTTGSGGMYTVDSSNFYEAAAAGFTVSQVKLFATGYLSTFPGGFPVALPFPVTQNFTMSSTGVLVSVTVATNPPGLAISVDGTAYTAPQTFQWQPSNAHIIATTTPQPISAGSQYAFASWSNGGAVSQTIVAPGKDTTYTASFNTQYLLTTTASPAADGIITAGGWFNAGSSVTITATPNAGFIFTGFLGDLTGTTNPQTLVMNAPMSVTASFAPSTVATTTSIIAPPVTYGTTATVTVTVSAAQGAPTGNVSLSIDNSGPLTLPLSGGSAVFNINGVVSGTHSLNAIYGAQGNFGASSATSSLLIHQATPTISISNVPSGAVFGGGFTIAYAYVGDGAPSTSSSTPSVCTVSGATASFVGVGTCTLTAHATGGINYTAATGTAQSFAISKATTSTTVASSQNPQLINQTITFTARVVGQSGGPTTGNVVFKSGATTLGTVSLSGNRASLSTSYATAGTRSITAQYAGDANNTASTSAALSQSVVTKFATTTTLTSSLNPSFTGQTVTLTASITSLGGTPPDGELITFKQGATVLGTAPLSSGIASFTTSSLTVGTHSLTASYAGDATFNASTSAAVAQVVNKYPTTTTLVSSLNPSIYGQSVTLTATVSSAGPSLATGSVTFKNGATVLATVTLTSGVATLTRTNLPAGTLPITATYNGDASSAVSTSTTLNQIVNLAATTTTVVSSRNPSTLGQSVKFTATVASPTITPTGTVTFSSGATVLATVALAGGKASFTTTTLPHGTNTVTATYNGAANITGSTGNVAQIVN